MRRNFDDAPSWDERRTWFLPPAAAAGLFFAAHVFLNFSEAPDARSVAGAGQNGPVARPVSVRMVAEIKPTSAQVRRVVPESEAALLELFRRDGAVLFSAEEVEVVATPERRFEPDEVGVITAGRSISGE